MTLKKKIAKWLKITANDIAEIDGYAPKKLGESRSVEFEINGLVESFCKVTEWTNGECYVTSCIPSEIPPARSRRGYRARTGCHALAWHAQERRASQRLVVLWSDVGRQDHTARALAAELNGRPAAKQQDYMELNGTDQRSIDDIRNMIQISKFKPSSKKRIIVIDEAQGVIANAPAAAALLKPLEEPSPDTLWILCSMEPSKFGNGNGKAIANRCTQFVLSPPSNMDCLKQATRIAKGEKMSYLDKELLKDVVRACGSEMRTLTVS